MMKCRTSLWLQVTLATIVLAAATAGHADDVQTLRVINDTRTNVTIRIKSQFPRNVRRPWVVRSLKPNQETKIELVSPDKFIVKVSLFPYTYQSLPMPLKKALAKDPRRALYVSTTQGADPRVRRFVPEVGLDLTLPRDEQPDFSQQELGPSDEQTLSQIINHRGGVTTMDFAGFVPEAPPAQLRRLGIYGYKCNQGIHIQSVSQDSPATNCRDVVGHEITLEALDHIASINGTRPDSFQHFVELVQQSERTMWFTIIDHRAGKEMTLSTNLW